MLRLSVGKNCSCNYQFCDQDGHSVCQIMADHYTRLCAAAQALLNVPITKDGPDPVAAYKAAFELNAVLNETTPVHQSGG